MSFQSSTESLLLNTSRLNADGNTEESLSTEALLNDNCVSSSTESLVNESVQELLNRLNMRDTSFAEREFSESTMASPILTMPSLATEGPANYEDGVTSDLKLDEGADALLSMLYNKIQVFLLRNKLSLEFLRIYKRYVECLFESGLNPLDDHYFHSLQNELSESYEFTSRMEEILDAFLVNPQNLIQKLVLFEHRRLYNLLRRHFEVWIWYCGMRRSLQQLESVWQEFLKRKYVLVWSKKYRAFANNLVMQAKDFDQFNLASSSFDKWLARIETVEAGKGLADHYVMDHVLQRMVKRINHILQQEEKSDSKHDMKCQKAVWRQWRLRACERSFTTRQKNLIRFFFSKARAKLKCYKESEDRADFTRLQLVLGSSLDKWRSQCNKENERLNSLLALETKFIKKKTMKILVKSFKKKEQELVVRKQLDGISQKLFFKDIWRTRFQERLHLYSFQRIIEERLLTKYSRVWKIRLFARLKANHFMGSGQLARFFHVWQLRASLSRYSSLNSKLISRTIFLLWYDHSMAEGKVRQFRHRSLQQKFWIKWNQKSTIIRNAKRQADVMRELCSATYFFNLWSERLRLIAAMEDRSKIFMNMQAFSKIKRGIAHMNEVHKLAKVYDPTLISRSVFLRFFHLWKEQAGRRRSDRLESMFQIVEKNLRHQSLRVHLQLWVQKIQLYRHHCLINAEQVYEKNLQLRYFSKANERLQKTQVLSKIGDSLRNKTLYLYFFYRWQHRYGYVQELLLKVDTENNKRNLALLLNYLNFWSMKILKLKRNEETVQVFRRRWDRAAVRGLMLLWKNKVDNSPSKKQSDKLQHQTPSYNGLVTPIRRSAAKNSTIPGSEGVKRYRIEAMKSHYGKIRRAIPSPVKSSTTLSSVAKKKIDSEGDAFAWSSRAIPPPRLSLERINKNLASKIDRINFERIPEARLDPFLEADSGSDPKIDTSFLEEQQEIEFDESPTRRT